MEDVEGCEEAREIVSMGVPVGDMQPASSAGEPLLQEGKNALWWNLKAMGKAERGASQVPSGWHRARGARSGGQVGQGIVMAPHPWRLRVGRVSPGREREGPHCFV